jgi:hypothetical protein
MDATGTREPNERIKNVSLSLFSAGMKWPRRTTSKSPAWKWRMASSTEPADTTKYPADFQAGALAMGSHGSTPTARTTVTDIKTSEDAND